MGYEWMARSECQVCAALQGIYEVPPPRPHHRCDCEIMELDWDTGICSNKLLNSEVDMGVHPWVIRLFGLATVVCPNGQEWTEHFEVERDFDQAVFCYDNDSIEAQWLEHDWQHDITDAIHDVYGTLQLNCSTFQDPTP